jgi:hypothetical protein
LFRLLHGGAPCESGISKEDLQKAVDKAGNSAATVRKELGIA